MASGSRSERPMKCIYESKIERFYQVPIKSFQVPIKSFKALVKLMGDLTALGWLARAARKSPQQAARALSRTVPLPRPRAHFFAYAHNGRQGSCNPATHAYSSRAIRDAELVGDLIGANFIILSGRRRYGNPVFLNPVDYALLPPCINPIRLRQKACTAFKFS